jgi:hypothetical protein
MRSLRRALPIAAAIVMYVLGASPALGAPGTPDAGWELTTTTFPTNLASNGHGLLEVDVVNVGAAASKGSITITDTLPPGLVATNAGNLEQLGSEAIGHSLWECAGATVVTCTNTAEMPEIAGGGGVPNRDLNGPNFQPQIGIAVEVLPGAKEHEVNRVTIAGGGAQTSASAQGAVTVNSNPAPFGFASWDGWLSNADGTLDTQAGSHPYELTTSFALNTLHQGEETLPAGGEMRNVEVELPPGLIGNPEAVPQCTRAEFNTHYQEGCPNASQIGDVLITFAGGGYFTERLYNMVPPPGKPAEFAFNLVGVNTFIDSAVRSGSDYGITVHSNNTPERKVMKVVVTVWGVPGDPSHEIWRNANSGGCSRSQIEEINLQLEESCKPAGGVRKPFLTLPTSCTNKPLEFKIRANTWKEEGSRYEASFPLHDGNGNPTDITGCENLSFGPTISTSPDTSAADTPAGLTVDVKPSTGGLLDPNGIGTSDIQNTSVTLPEGVVINPGQAAGLEACQESEANIYVEGVAPVCPLKSKVGTVEAEVPILKSSLKGNVYVLQSNPPNLRLLITASGEGVEVKLPLLVHLDAMTGRLTATLDGTPQAPVSDFKLSFSGGAQAALATPAQCGTYTTTSDFTPWASPFVADVFPTAAFAVTSGTDGARCPGSILPFSPSLIAGSTTDQAGGFTAFSLLLQAADDQQRIEKLQFKIPQGLLGMISRVPLCGEAQAQQGTCSAASQIGHTVVASGPGPYPLVVPQPGQPPAAIYLTGPYKGAPYGLSIVVPVVVGPFTLDTQIVRAKIEVDPLTAQITVTTDPFPQVIDGVPTDLRTINAVIDRSGFMFNPTSCSPMSFSGTAYSAQGASVPISSPFQMGSCRALTFKPDLKVSTTGKNSRKNGASLDAKILYPSGPLGANQASSQSNIKSVKVDLPKQLPSRLTTLQKACTSATFDADPANCPAASKVGTVTAVTPVLPVTLTGPAYFVSYGGAKFPELVFVLQGYGVTIYVHGETFISKAGITSSTFRQIPDVPIYSFELKLPQGPFSALAANGNLCKSSLKMPTTFTGQDGAVIHQSTPIGVTGCVKAKKAKSKHKGTRPHGKKK